MIALLVLASLVLSTYNWTPEIPEDDTESSNLLHSRLIEGGAHFSDARAVGQSFATTAAGTTDVVATHMVHDSSTGDSIIAGFFMGEIDQFSGDVVGTETISFGNNNVVGSGFVNLFVAMIDSNGAWQWADAPSFSSTFVPELAITGMELTSDGGAVLGGYYYGDLTFDSISASSTGWYDGWVGKISNSGNWEWVKELHAPADDFQCRVLGRGLAVDSSDNVYQVGSFVSNITASTCPSTDVGSNGDQTYDGYTIKLNSNGQEQWHTQSTNAGSNNVLLDIIVSGTTIIALNVFETSVTFGSTTENINAQAWSTALATISSSGQWTGSTHLAGVGAVSNGVEDISFPVGLAEGPNGEVLVSGFFGNQLDLAGQTYTSTGENDSFLLDIDTSLAENWATILSGPDDDIIGGMLTDVSGNITITAAIDSDTSLGPWTNTLNGGDLDTYIATLNSSGVVTGEPVNFGGTMTDDVIAANAMAMSSNGLILAGAFLGDIDLDDDGTADISNNDDVIDVLVWIPDLGPKDFDEDGVFDPEDNCPTIPNADQLDYDGDEQPGVIPSQSSGNFGGDECDNDDDEDQVEDVDDNCPLGELGWISNSDAAAGEVTDLDGDGCKDATEDLDDDGDGICDSGGPSTYGLSGSCLPSYTGQDDCPDGETGWLSGDMIADANGNPVSTDHDSDGCKDEGIQNNQFGEDVDDDNDDMDDPVDYCPKGEINWTSTLETDRDQDGCRDAGEDLNDDNDDYLDANDNCPFIFGTSIVDRRGCLDSDGDGYSDSDENWTVDDGADAFPYESTQWRDSDFDGYGDNPTGFEADDCPTSAGTSEFDRRGCPDADSDGYSDPGAAWPAKDCPSLTGVCGDALPDDSTQWTDFDGDGYGDNYNNQSWSDSRDSAWPGGYVFLAKDQDACPLLPGTSVESGILGCPDADGDGWADFADAFPANACQYKDTDGDGYGDNPECEDYDDCLLQPGTSTADRLGCTDTDGDGFSDPTSNWLPDDCGADACADAYVDDVTQWKDTDGDGFGDNPNGTTPDQCIELPEDVDGNEDDDGCPEEETILGGGLSGVFDGDNPMGMIAIGAALLLVIVASVLLLRRRGGKEDYFDDGYGDSQMEAYVQQMIAQGYPEATARAYAQQQFGVAAAAAAPAAGYAAQPAAAAPAQVAASTATNPRMEAYVQQLIQQGYPEETARAYAMQYADRF